MQSDGPWRAPHCNFVDRPFSLAAPPNVRDELSGVRTGPDGTPDAGGHETLAAKVATEEPDLA